MVGRYYSEAIDDGADYLRYGVSATAMLIENKKAEMEKPKPSKAVLDLREIAADFDGDIITSEIDAKAVKTSSCNKKKFVHDLKFENKIKKGRRKNKVAAQSRKRNRK